MANPRLTHQQVEMLGHDHIPDQRKSVTLPREFECLHKQVAECGSAQSGSALVATARDEVQVFQPVVAVQTLRHVRILLSIPVERTPPLSALASKDGAPNNLLNTSAGCVSSNFCQEGGAGRKLAQELENAGDKNSHQVE